jgi:hypothetical protein
MGHYPRVVTPECFYRGYSQSFAWIPALRVPQGREPSRTAKSMREWRIVKGLPIAKRSRELTSRAKIIFAL